jgi:hypothetical protein
MVVSEKAAPHFAISGPTILHTVDSVHTHIECNNSIYRVGIFSDDILVLNYAGYYNDDN